MNNMYGFGGFGFSELPQLMQLRNMREQVDSLEAQIPDTKKVQKEIEELEAKKRQKVSVNTSNYDMEHEARIRQHAQDERDKLDIDYCTKWERLDPSSYQKLISDEKRLNHHSYNLSPEGFIIFRRICLWITLIASIALWAIFVLPKDSGGELYIWVLWGIIAMVIWIHQLIKKIFVLPDYEWNIPDKRIPQSLWGYPFNRAKRFFLCLFVGAILVAISGAVALIIVSHIIIYLPLSIYTIIFMIASPIAMSSQRKRIKLMRCAYKRKLEKINKEEAESLAEARRLDNEQTRLYNDAIVTANSNHKARIQAQIDSKRNYINEVNNNYRDYIQQVNTYKQYYLNCAANWGIERYSLNDYDNLIRVMQRNGCSTIAQGKQVWDKESYALLYQIEQQEAREKYNAEMKEFNRQQERQRAREREDAEQRHRERMEAERRTQDEIEKLRKEIERYNR